MTGRRKYVRRRAAVLAVAALCVVALGGTALAGHQTSGVKSYTGCLVSGDGVIIKIKEGNTPKSACTGGQVEAHFSGGDVTKISVGSGLALPNGGDNGEVRIELAAGQTLPTGCATGRVVEWNGSAWVCGVDDDTHYSAGTGLDLSSGNAFSIEPDYRLPGKACTTSGQFARGFDPDGDILCAAPSGGGVQAYSAHVGLTTMAGDTLVISKTLPAGTYLLFATVALVNQDGNAANDGESEARCKIPGYDTGSVELVFGDVETAETKVSVALSSAITHASGAVELRCEETASDVDVWNATLTAIKVDSLG